MNKKRLEEIKKIYPPYEGPIRKNQKIHEGDKFGQWTVLYRSKNRPNNHRTFFICECDCGTVKEVWGDHLRRGNSMGCGKGACNIKSRILNQINPIKKTQQVKNELKGFFIYKYVENNKIIYIGKK